MVMADFGSRDRGKRGRGRGYRRRGVDRDRGGYYGERDDEDEDYPPPHRFRTPVILAKPFSERGSQNDYYKNHVREAQSPKAQQVENKPIVMLKSHDGVESKSKQLPNNSGNQSNITNMLANDTMPSHVYKDKQPQSGKTVLIEGSLQSRLAAPPEMTRSMKLIDENMNWCENPFNMLLDQTDFLTVGVIGLQGVGKSTILSILSGNFTHDPEESFVFKPQSKDARDVCSHQTMGVDMFVTGERVVYLDTQPLLSASVLDYMIHNDKKFSTDFNTAENCIEMQSLQVASFMLTVCNVVVVVLDWFADLNFLRLLETAEMLKPATPSGGQENNHDSANEFYPHIVFVLNKADGEDFSPESYTAMQNTLSKVFQQSKLKYTGGLNMVSSGLMPKKRGKKAERDINLFLLPSYNLEEKEQEGANQKEGGKDGVFGLMAGYNGHHTFSHSAQKLRNTLFAMPRQLHTHTTLSEKNWFHYAARSWDSIKKSVLFSEYNRLLP